MTLEQKVLEAKEVIKTALAKHGNKVYLAYSGGKDSQAVLKLAKSVRQDIIVIHNEHEGEDIKEKNGVLVVKKPKTQVPKFLEMVKLEAQIDGTRKDEDDMVVVDGELIHRSKLQSAHIINGLFGLEVYLPLLNFTEEEVYDYLQK